MQEVPVLQMREVSVLRLHEAAVLRMHEASVLQIREVSVQEMREASEIYGVQKASVQELCLDMLRRSSYKSFVASYLKDDATTFASFDITSTDDIKHLLSTRHATKYFFEERCARIIADCVGYLAVQRLPSP